MPSDPSSCIFCKIVAGQVPARIVARSEGALAFLDVQPLAEGHTMVIPTHHHQHLPDLCPEDVDAVFRLAQRVARAQREVLGAEAVTLGVNDGAAAGQVVPHLHVHLVPRRDGDGAGNVHAIFPTRGEPPTDALAECLAEALQRS